MAFYLIEDWLKRYYGSANEQQERDTEAWLRRYGIDVTEEQIAEWKKWKHLAEYQVNTLDIVPKVLNMTNYHWPSELTVHKMINQLRVPLSVTYELPIIYVQPKRMLELGVGGDSAISTAVFLSYMEILGGKLESVDINPLGMTWIRYKDYPFWHFTQSDSKAYLQKAIDLGQSYDLIFIDTSHSYEDTVEETRLASMLTKNILFDDATFEGNPGDKQPGGVKRAIKEWMEKNGSAWRGYRLASDAVFFMTCDARVRLPI